MRDRHRVVGAALAAGLLLTGCSGPRYGQAASPAASPPASPAVRDAALDQSAADIQRTVRSLRQVDDLPLYEMTFHGSYDREVSIGEEDLAGQADGWACSLFHLRGDRPLFGRNFDWDPNPAMVVHADPPDGYASVSMADLAYLLGGTGAPDLSDPGIRRRLAHAVLTPFDGVNEKGLAVGMAAVPGGGLPPKTEGRPTVSSVRIIRMMLDKAATVDEAVAIMRRHNVDFTSGPQVHYLLADAAGKSAVVEFAGGRLNVIEDRILTNFTMTGTSDEQRRSDTRYGTLATGLPSAKNWRDGMDLLQRVAQGHTRWSVVYDLTDATARVVTARRWERVHTIALSQR
ncbi:carcinine hydrolase/isopenicillin-N N-acyltransferase family protein [Streptosporangium sp. NBC_01756]|uniref:carcinine hydrolase/isopenicillin-N N-acyltransferase family protein n=1 Tax=Streptosporangium sp. NBC_01756 TaxID=2975950 RepID=UPI002DDB891B|nr:carcinine hydrolase/isopenicillin-N N-acyltransferase family protein [Streptosporangium sp. NBC_01756]WSC87086.1 carcinine hydrolase/isopenicillin-N N-acyltransferase family protein [Streptosporangium sp. NBC_01756]